jgi:large subunit ribosomal protein L23
MGIFKRKKDGVSDDVATPKKADEKVEEKVTDKKPKTEKKAKKKASEKKTASVKLGVRGSELVIKPLITEKSATLASENQYVFVVAKKANRIEIREAIQAMYGVTPISVNIQNVRGKKVRFGRRFGKRKDWKKAIVTLPEGKTINVYDGV